MPLSGGTELDFGVRPNVVAGGVVPAPRHGPLGDVGLSILARTDCETDMRARGFADLLPPTRSRALTYDYPVLVQLRIRAGPHQLIHSTGQCMPQERLIMLGKLSIIVAVAAVLMIPAGLSAQIGGAANPGVHVGGAVNPGATVRGAVERGISGPDLGTWRSPSTDNRSHHKHKTTTKPRR
jgi:hypothetical protein